MVYIGTDEYLWHLLYWEKPFRELGIHCFSIDMDRKPAAIRYNAHRARSARIIVHAFIWWVYLLRLGLFYTTNSIIQHLINIIFIFVLPGNNNFDGPVPSVFGNLIGLSTFDIGKLDTFSKLICIWSY